MHLKKSVTGLQISAFKNCNKLSPVPKANEDQKFKFLINAHTPIEKKSNHD